MDTQPGDGTARSSRKACVSPSFYYSKFSEDRPKGKNKGMFSSISSQSFTSINTEILRPNSNRKHFSQGTRPNPILQQSFNPNTRSGKKIIDSTPSSLIQYSNNRKFNLPSELGLGTRFEKHYSSKVFQNSGDSKEVRPVKALLDKPGEVRNLIKYSYALPFKDNKITPKIG